MNDLQQIGQGIRTFDQQRQLKRSETFDHSTPAIDSASLRLTLSIQHFDKTRSLKRAQTLDRSSACLRPLEHSLSIQHFDCGTLKHVEPVDKSRPLHIYSLTRNFSSYCNYADTPTVEKSVDFAMGANTEVIEQIIEDTPNNDQSENQEKGQCQVTEETKDDNMNNDVSKDQEKVNSQAMEETKESDLKTAKSDGNKDQGTVNSEVMKETMEVNPNNNRNDNQEKAVIPECSDYLTAETTSVQSDIDDSGLFEDLVSPNTSAIGEDWISCDIVKADCKELEVSESNEPGPQEENHSEVTNRLGDYAINTDIDVINIASEVKALG